jgi:hypothetical protein
MSRWPVAGQPIRAPLGSGRREGYGPPPFSGPRPFFQGLGRVLGRVLGCFQDRVEGPGAAA